LYEFQWAIDQYLKGISPESIYLSLGRSKAWLYKWLSRYDPDSPDWFLDRSKCPLSSPQKIDREIEEIIKLTRLSLYNQDLFCGAQAILWELEEEGVQPLPSLRTINRILSRHELTHRRTGRYVPKGAKYPSFSVRTPNDRHQGRLCGPSSSSRE
jgi:putative transposase